MAKIESKVMDCIRRKYVDKCGGYYGAYLDDNNVRFFDDAVKELERISGYYGYELNCRPTMHKKCFDKELLYTDIDSAIEYLKKIKSEGYNSIDEEYELRAEGKGDEIEYFPGEWIDWHWAKNSIDYIKKNEDVCTAPYIDDVIDWLESKHRVLVVVSPTFKNGYRLSEKYGKKYGVVFANQWIVDVYSVGNPITDVYRDGEKIEGFFADSLVDWSGDEHEKFNSRIEAAKHGIEYALDNYVKCLK